LFERVFDVIDIIPNHFQTRIHIDKSVSENDEKSMLIRHSFKALAN